MSKIYNVFEHLQLLLMDIWLYTHTVTPTDVFPDLGELAEILGNLSEQTMTLRYSWGYWNFQTASHIHVIHIYELFKHLQLLWMGTWIHTHTITTTDLFPDLRELAEILGDVIVQTMPLHYGWGFRTFQTASHIQVIHIWGVWAPSTIVNGIWLHTHTVITTDIFPDLGELAEILGDVSVQTTPLQYLRL